MFRFCPPNRSSARYNWQTFVVLKTPRVSGTRSDHKNVFENDDVQVIYASGFRQVDIRKYPSHWSESVVDFYVHHLFKRLTYLKILFFQLFATANMNFWFLRTSIREALNICPSSSSSNSGPVSTSYEIPFHPLWGVYSQLQRHFHRYVNICWRSLVELC